MNAASPSLAPTVPIRSKARREISDNGLVAAYLEGDEQAFTELYQRYRHKIINYIYRGTSDYARAEDLTQEVFIRVVRHVARFDQTNKFSTWIYVIADNLRKNELRNRSRNPLTCSHSRGVSAEDYSPILNVADRSPRPDEVYWQKRLGQAIGDAIDQLPEYHRSTFVLREFEDQTYDEIAQTLGINVGTVKSRLSRARNNFAHIIEPMLG
jgi:RNA polymerase sigma-70 factor (ECF subfamily)